MECSLTGSGSAGGAAASKVGRTLLVCDLPEGLYSSFAFMLFFWVERPTSGSVFVSNKIQMWLLWVQ